MDDLKIFLQSKTQLKQLVSKTHEFTRDINMLFEIDKCVVAYIEAGLCKIWRNRGLESMSALEPGQYYKYLGINERQQVDPQGIKDRLKREYFHRLRKILCYTDDTK